ncbi:MULTISPECIES: HopJ type III effector protein [Modicisalibacter]|uniref:HopJ type III effector protein n=1 Tax=Modicisalibacter TaxID=574347 RepID=UPI00100BED4D|nr:MULTISPECIES: HopJ type III effector protein [Halomonadaceae]MBZ9557087.1 HopJ type III effector protein [Modicisalibacter sp. R2A 31.J]MBZ9574199.1 HopJ type III effector protein [Modicisalibacter sp. MOD 31.J]
MTLDDFLHRLRNAPDTLAFADTLAVIDRHYRFTPVGFRNGEVTNAPGENAGSCRVLAFARRHELDVEQTLHCFGEVYRDEVLGDPQGHGHRNIREFRRRGWAGVAFDAEPLAPRDGAE